MVQATDRISPFAVFRNRNFTVLWLAQLVSEMGTSLVSLTASIYVYRLTGSTLSVGLMLMATAAPSLLIGLVAGVYVDRYDRRRVMIAADLVRAVLAVLIALLLPAGIAWLYVLTFLTACAAQFFAPAHASLLPELASDEELTAANSMMAVSQYGALIFGFALAGLIAERYPIQLAFYIDALTYLFSAVCVFAVAAPPSATDESTSATAVWKNLQAGVRAISGDQMLRSLFLAHAPGFLIVGVLSTLYLPFSLEVLGATEFQYGMIESVTIVGFVLGSFFMAARGDRLREGQWISASLIGTGITTILFSRLSSVGPALAVSTVEGVADAPGVVARSLVIQRNTARKMRGRVFSAFFVMRDSLYLVGMAAGGLGDVIGVQPLYFAGGIAALIAGAWTLFVPGLGQPAEQWRRSIRLLREAPAAPGLGMGRPAILPDFDRLIAHFPALNRLDVSTRQALVDDMVAFDARRGAVVVRQGEESDSAYFILDGRAVAGVEEEGRHRILEVMNPGDFFGEIAVITGMPRTADVVLDEDSTLLEVPADVVRSIMNDPELYRIFISQARTRLDRSHLLDNPRFCLIDQGVLADLRTPRPTPPSQ